MRIKIHSTFAKTWSCILLLQFLSVSAVADEADKRTWYLGTGLGITELDPDAGSTGYSLTSERDTGFKLFAGFDYSERLTLEGFYADLGSAELGNHVIKPDGTIDYSTMGVSALFYFWRNGDAEASTLRKGLQLYLHGGLSFLDNSASVSYQQDNSVQVQYGAGVEYGLKNGLALRAGLDLYDKDAGMVFVGILKRFGTKSKRKVLEEPVIEAVIEVVPEVIVIADVDTDKDGVIDRLDECANSPLDIDVDEKGCSIIAVEIEGVNFEPQSFELTKDSKRILDEAASIIKANPELRIEVQAHTDSKGSEKYNLKLSQQRAASVKKYLVSQGVDEAQLESKGYGESQPIADNESKQGRAKNRRVELNVIKDNVTEPENDQPSDTDVTESDKDKTVPVDASVAEQTEDLAETNAEQDTLTEESKLDETVNNMDDEVKTEEKKTEPENLGETGNDVSGSDDTQ